MPNFKAILFDIDDTLCNTSESKKLVFEQMYDANEKFQTVSKNQFTEILEKERQEYLAKSKGFQTYARMDLWLRMINALKIQLSVRELKAIIDNYWKFSIENLKLFENAKKIIQNLRDLNIITSVLASSDFYSKSSKLIHLGIDNLFNYVFTTDIVKLSKNDPQIYRYVATFLKLQPQEILMVGNDPNQDILPAKSVGLKTAQVVIGDTRTPQHKEADFTITSLQQVLSIV